MANYDGLTRNAWPGTWSTNGTHPIVLDVEMRGGLRLVTGLESDTLVNIPSGMLQDGMLAYVASGYHADVVDNTYYKYSILAGESRDANTGFLPNASGNWSEFSLGGGDVTTEQLNYVSGIAVYSSGQAIENETQISSVSGWAESYVDSQDHSAVAVSGWAGATFQTKQRTYNNITSDFTMTDSSDVVFIDTSSDVVSVSLPTAVGKGGQELLFKFKDGSNSGVLIGNGSETIDGNSVYPLYHKNQSVSLISDNFNWYVV